MKMTDIRCPVCRTINRNLYLEETGGWFECECCGCLVHLGDDPEKVDTLNISMCHYSIIKTVHKTA